MKKVLTLLFALIMALGLATAAWGDESAGVDCSAGCSDTANHVAAIGDIHYTSIQAAVDGAVDGDKITVIKDHAMDCSTDLIVIDSKELTIDLNGCVITVDNTAGSSFTAVIWIKNEGKLTVQDSSIEKKGGISVTAATEPNGECNVECIFLNYNSDQPDDNPNFSLIINGGTYTMNNSNDCIIYSQCNNTTLVTGGSFTLESVGTRSNGSPWILNAKGQNVRHVIVTGGTFNADINHQYYPFEVDMPVDRALKNNGDSTWTVVDAVVYVNEPAWSSTWYIHQVGYASIKDAVAGADSNKEKALDIQKSHRDKNINKNYKIEFDNKENVIITNEGSAATTYKIFNLVNPVNLTVRENGVAATVAELNAITPTIPASVQYGCSTDGNFPTTWQNSTLFEGLTPDTAYTFFARYTEENAAIVVSETTVTTDKDHTNIFIGGDATGAAPEEVTPTTDGTIILPENTFDKDGFVFDGWSDGTNTYQPGDTYTMPEGEDVVFIPLWKEEVPTPPTPPTPPYYGGNVTDDDDAEEPEDKPAEETPATPPVEEDVVTPEPEDTTPDVVPDEPPVVDDVVVDEPSVDNEPEQRVSVAVWVVVGVAAVAAGVAAIIIGKKRKV